MPGRLFVFHILGGNALVLRDLAMRYHPEWVEPRATARHGVVGFVAAEGLPPGFQRRTPTRKQRMRVLKRDNLRCRICGRRPDDNVDLELHVHHILPWASGGVTADDNLITLCQTCHGGLDPHSEPALFDYLGIGYEQLQAQLTKDAAFEKSKAYRTHMLKLLRSVAATGGDD